MSRTNKISVFFIKEFLIVFFALMFSLAGCSQSEDHSNLSHKSLSSQNNTAPKKKLSSVSIINPSSRVHSMTALKYDLENLIDPFEPLADFYTCTDVIAEKPKNVSASLNTLETLDMSSLHLTGIVFSKNQKIALLEEAGGKGHQVGIGSFVGKNKGVVTDIFKNRILIKELGRDGKEKLLEIKLHKDG